MCSYYPLPESEAANLRALLAYTKPAAVIDPCAGQGDALCHLTKGTEVLRYGIELDAERARIASSKEIATIQGSTFDAIAKPESFSLLYLNPPYDSEIGSIANRRMEAVFLEHTYRWLRIEGVLVLVIPFERLYDCSGVLSSHFASLNIFRMTDPASTQYRQIVALGVRRDVRGGALESNRSPTTKKGSLWVNAEPARAGVAGVRSLFGSAIRSSCSDLPRSALRPPRRPIAQFHRLEAGRATVVATRGCRDRPTDYAAARRSRGAIVHGRSSKRRIRQ